MVFAASHAILPAESTSVCTFSVINSEPRLRLLAAEKWGDAAWLLTALVLAKIGRILVTRRMAIITQPYYKPLLVRVEFKRPSRIDFLRWVLNCQAADSSGSGLSEAIIPCLDCLVVNEFLQTKNSNWAWWFYHRLLGAAEIFSVILSVSRLCSRLRNSDI